MEYKDYYQTLGIGKDASADDVQRAYRKLARKFHPDVNQEAGAEDRFKEISEAYEVLKDAEKRAKYDRFGSAWKASGGRPGAGPPPGFEGIHFEFGGGDFAGASGFSSFFESLFGGGRGGPFAGGGFAGAGFGGERGFGGARTARGRDQETRIVLSLEEAARGGPREITVSDPATGRSNTFQVTIPPGVRPGQRIRLSGRGEEGPGGAGDLYLVVELRPHPRLRLEGRDLHTTLPVPPWDAALGGEATLGTLDGPVTVRVPAGSSSGRRIRLRGKGFPDAKGGAGDLFAEIRVVVPETLSDRERALFEELRDASNFRPR